MIHDPANGLVLTSDNHPLSEPNRAQGDPLHVAQIPMLDTVPPSVMDYVQAALADNTRRAYASDVRHFLAWGGSFPATEGMIARYLVEHAATLAIATLTRRLIAISVGHTSRGLPSPTASQLVRLTMRGIRHRHGRPQRRVAAATVKEVRAMVAALGDDLRARRDCALLLVGFAGAFRRSELCAIDCTDLARVPEGLVVALRRSKTDQIIAAPYSRLYRGKRPRDTTRE